jgi:hypothetical protein
MNLEALKELAAKVEAGEDWPSLYDGTGLYSLISSALGNWSWEVVEGVTKSYRGSLDAAKALHDAVLPGWHWGMQVVVNGFLAAVGKPTEYPNSVESRFDVVSDDPARALLLAILRALIAQEEAA